MIISSNSTPDIDEFNSLLRSAVDYLNQAARKSLKEVRLLAGNKLEPYVKDVVSEYAKGTSFENSIELISGQKFPDIIAKKYFGIEVKSTTQNHWKTTGNSVLESTRVDGIERIFMLFGKLANPIEFRFRPYEECLSEVVVTHSPRYLIDMNLANGATIFDKLEISYDELRVKPNPLKPVVDYYRARLKPGEDIWWMDSGVGSDSSNLIIKIWTNLTENEKRTVTVKAMAFFPELFSNSASKFGRVAVWLIKRESIVCPNIRDLFTAGGKADIVVGEKTYYRLPKIIKKLFDNLDLIVERLSITPIEELQVHWNRKTTEKMKISTWVNIVGSEAQKLPELHSIDIKEMLFEKLAGRF